jgi:arylsulfatase A-like enzyme
VFLWLHYLDPHHPYHERQPFFDAFKPPSASRIAEVRKTTFQQIVANWMKAPDPSVAPLVLSHYDAEIRYVDQHLQSLFRELPFLDRCFAVFTSDHGEEFLDHGRTGHGVNLYNETVRVPLVVRPPGGGPSAYRTDTVSLIDVAPTILAAAGGRAPVGWQGAVIVDDHGAPVPQLDRMVLSDLARNRRLPRSDALAGSRWKIVVNIDTGVAELFDLRKDPRERVDLAADNARLAGAFFARLEATIRSLPPAPDTVAPAVDEQTTEQLRLLGYVDAPSPPPRPPAPTPTPER